MSRAALALALIAAPAAAENLYAPGNWSALASDRRAYQVGDLLTIIVYEASSASNAATSGSKKNTNLSGRVSAGSHDASAGLGLGGTSDNQGMTGRSGQMVAQISATVEEVLAGGDMRVAGTQLLNLNGEKTVIKVRGRVRAADISAANAVLSSRLADAQIDYNGSGFVSRSGRPGLLTRIFNWLGVV